MEILVNLGCKVTFAPDNLEYRQPYVMALQQLGVEVQFHPYTRSISMLLGTRGDEFDAVILSRHYIAAKHIDGRCHLIVQTSAIRTEDAIVPS